MARSNDPEIAAAQAVQRVLGGTWELHDTGTKPGQVDVLLELEDRTRVALEVTSEGDRERYKTASALKSLARTSVFNGESLSCLWHVSVSIEKRVSELPWHELEETLRGFEAQELEVVSSRGAHPIVGDRNAWSLARLGLESAIRWNESPPVGEPRIIVGWSYGQVGGHMALPTAIERVLEREDKDNQKKLAAADADARHLYVVIDDHAAGAALRGMWPPLPACPSDPCGVIDVLWVFAPWASAFLHRVTPGTDHWEHFVMATGEHASESVLRES